MKNVTLLKPFARRGLRLSLGLAGGLLACASAYSVRAQGQIALGTISASGTGPYTYSLAFSDSSSATSPIGSIWYSWVPGSFYLPGTPTSASAPTGWTATVDGHSVQYIASTAADDIMPGHSLSGFGYTAVFSPSQLAAAPNSGTSVAYSGGLFSDAGNTFTVTLVPEPSSGLLMGVAASVWALGRWRSKVAAD
jgi:hypothetical protein